MCRVLRRGARVRRPTFLEAACAFRVPPPHAFERRFSAAGLSPASALFCHCALLVDSPSVLPLPRPLPPPPSPCLQSSGPPPRPSGPPYEGVRWAAQLEAFSPVLSSPGGGAAAALRPILKSRATSRSPTSPASPAPAAHSPLLGGVSKPLCLRDRLRLAVGNKRSRRQLLATE